MSCCSIDVAGDKDIVSIYLILFFFLFSCCSIIETGDKDIVEYLPDSEDLACCSIVETGDKDIVEYLPDSEDLSCCSIVETGDKDIVGDPHDPTQDAQLPGKILVKGFQ